MQKDLKKSKASSCWECALRKKGGINAFGICTWFEEPKEIPSRIVDKGCRFWRDEQAQYIIDNYGGILIN